MQADEKFPYPVYLYPTLFEIPFSTLLRHPRLVLS